MDYTIDTYAAYNFGFYRFIVFVKFESGKMPPVEEMKRTLEADPHVQLVMLAKGDFDLFVYIWARGESDS